MRLSADIPRLSSPDAIASWATAMESAGIDRLWCGEAYGFDAVSLLGFLSCVTSRVEIGSSILPIFSRSPALLAMTAAGLDFVSSGRFVLGLGSSGPQVIHGWHGVEYDRPVERTRDTIEICRQIWRREKLNYSGAVYQLPVGDEPGLKLINHPLRSDIPVHLAALGPKNVAVAAELADGWLPIFFHPGKADVWREALADGASRRSSDRPALEVTAGGLLAVCREDEAVALRNAERARVALYVGGMGAQRRNYYNNLFGRYGYEDEAARIQDLYLSGDKAGAARGVPEEFLRETMLVGEEGHVRGRIAAYQAAGVTCLNVYLPASLTEPERLIEKVRGWV